MLAMHMGIFCKDYIFRYYKDFNLDSLKVIYTGAAKVSKNSIDDIRKALKHVQIFNVYGKFIKYMIIFTKFMPSIS